MTTSNKEITYQDHLEGIEMHHLMGFFVGWPQPPSSECLSQILKGSKHIWLARHLQGGVVGFINAISDGVLSAYIPLLEVLPDYQGQGIGKALAQRMLRTLEHLYMIDLACDKDLIPFYESLGGQAAQAVLWRNYAVLKNE